MKKVKIILLALIVGTLVVGGSVLAGTGAEKSDRVYVLTDNSVIKAMLGVRHEFKEAFSTKASARVKALSALGLIKTEPVQIYKISAKPTCGDGFIFHKEECGEPGLSDCTEGFTCENCKCVESGVTPPPPTDRICSPASQIPWGIDRVNGGSGGAGVNVAVLDTGVYKEHLDLAGRMTEFCMDYTKYPRLIKNTCADGHGHGTHVAGTILADGGEDGLGIFGVAPEANLMVYKVLKDNGIGYSDDIAAAIIRATNDGANIISMSLGGASPDSFTENAVDYAATAGVLVVAAAGNSGPTSDSMIYPAAYDNVVAVAAFDESNKTAYFSSQGLNDNDWFIEDREIEFTAPGVYVYSTYEDGCYATMSGTSMATPHIAGIAARDWKGSASDTRLYLQGLAKVYNDYGLPGDDIEAGFGLPIVE